MDSYCIASDGGRLLKGNPEWFWIELPGLSQGEVSARYQSMFSNLPPHKSYAPGFAMDGGALVLKRPLKDGDIFAAALKDTAKRLRGTVESRTAFPAIFLCLPVNTVRQYTCADVKRLTGENAAIASTPLCCGVVDHMQYWGKAQPAFWATICNETTFAEAVEIANSLQPLGCFRVDVTYLHESGKLESCVLQLQ